MSSEGKINEPNKKNRIIRQRNLKQCTKNFSQNDYNSCLCEMPIKY